MKYMGSIRSILSFGFRRIFVSIVAATALCSKNLQLYSSLSVALEKECLIWSNGYRFYILGIAARAPNSAPMP